MPVPQMHASEIGVLKTRSRPKDSSRTFRRLERAAVIGHVLAVKQHALVAFHFLDQRLADGVLVGDFAVDALDFRQRLDDFHLGKFGGNGFALRVGIHVFDHVLGGRIGGGGGALGGAGVAVADGFFQRGKFLSRSTPCFPKSAP